jgi:hypothetical protein
MLENQLRPPSLMSPKRPCARALPLLWTRGLRPAYRIDRAWLISTAHFEAINGMRRWVPFDSAQKDLALYREARINEAPHRMRKSRTTASVSSLPAAIQLCRRKDS